MKQKKTRGTADNSPLAKMIKAIGDMIPVNRALLETADKVLAEDIEFVEMVEKSVKAQGLDTSRIEMLKGINVKMRNVIIDALAPSNPFKIGGGKC